MAASLPLDAYQAVAAELLARPERRDSGESVFQDRQRRITEDSLTVLRRRQSGFTVFGELAIVYEAEGRLQHIAPANAVALGEEDDPRRQCWNWGHEPNRLLAIFEYRTADDARTLRNIYGNVLKVPYAVFVDHGEQTVEIVRGEGEPPVSEDAHGRFEVPELDLKLGMFSGWLRFWHHDRLLPIAEEQDEQLEEKDLLIYEQTSEIQDQRTQIADLQQEVQDLQQELAAVRERFHERLVRRARAAGREDLLHQIDPGASLEQLELWFDELGG